VKLFNFVLTKRSAHYQVSRRSHLDR